MTPFHVQKTNETSTVSKASCAERGFFSDPYIKLFIRKYRKRCPSINHGYFMRNFAVNSVISDFISQSPNCQIVVIGSGFDTLFFNLRDRGHSPHFIEIDFERVLNKKLEVVDSTPELRRHVTERQPRDEFILLNTADYKMIGVDIRDSDLLCSLLLEVSDCQRPTLFLSECVLTYIGRRSSNNVIRLALRYFDHVVFCLYEQMRPDDTFGRIMVDHFHNGGTPLYGALGYPTLGHQRDRFAEMGFEDFRGVDMMRAYSAVVPDEVKFRITRLDPFDEMEEFFQTIAHYFIACASRGVKLTRFGIFSAPDESRPPSRSLLPGEHFVLLEKIPVKYHAHRCIILHDSNGNPLYLVIGGYGELSKGRGKSADPLLLDWEGNKLHFRYEGCAHQNEFLRLFFAAHLVKQHNKFIVFGGRCSPLKPQNSLLWVELYFDSGYVIHFEQVDHCGDVPPPCWRFASALIESETRLFVHGGLTAVPHVTDECHLLDIAQWRWRRIKPRGQPPPLVSHSATEDGGKIYIFGGLGQNHAVSSDLYVVDVESFCCRRVETGLEARFSHTAHVYEGRLILCGGIDGRGLNAGVGVYDLVGGGCLEFGMPMDGLMLFLHDSHLVEVNGEYVVRILGGGCQCFTFGSHVNRCSLDIRVERVIARRDS